MGRVSLTESYDDRSVISKLNEMDKRVTENTTVVTSAEASAKASAAAAQETADRFAGSVGAVVQNANAQINASKAQVDQAKAEVDEAVTTVAQAVQTANNASASAQQSAQTVAGYDDRVTALETADSQNVKINKINQYAVGLTGNQDNITGIKTFVSGILNITSGNPEIRYYDDKNKTNLLAGVGVRFKTATSTNAAIRSYAPKINPADNNEIQMGGFLQLVSNQNGTMTLSIFGTKADGKLVSKVLASFDGTTWS